MENIDSIFQQLDENGEIKKIRSDIVDLITHHLQILKSSLGYWEKTHFAIAIASLAYNINSHYKPTDLWLRLCLVNVKKALVPAEQRNENYTPRDNQIETLTYEQLIEAIESLRKMVS